MRYALIAILLLGVPGSALAQYAATFEELPAATKKGQKLFVFDHEGNEVRGRLQAVTADSVTLLVDKRATRELMRDEITLIRRPAQDSVLNGVAIGAAVTTTVGLISLLGCGDCSGAGQFMIGALVWGGGIGALVDASILTPRDIYRVGKRRFEVQPLSSRSATGARVAIAW